MQYLFSNNTPDQIKHIIKSIDKLNINKSNYQIIELYKIYSDKSLVKSTISKLSKLLNAKALNTEIRYARTIGLASRSGLLSPWSSKANQIISSCISDSIIEAEKIHLITFKNIPSYNLASQNTKALHDKMTEICLFTKDSLKNYLYNV